MPPWPQQLLHVVDFEGSVGSGILEYGVVSMQAGRIVGTHTRLCAATGRVRPEDAAVHGLDAAALAGNAPFSSDWELFATLRETGPLAAHFASAEHTMLKAVWPHPRPSPDFATEPPAPGALLDWGPWIDTGRLAPQLLPPDILSQAGSAQLATLIAACGLQGTLDQLAATHCPPERTRYHAALYDALAAALLLGLIATLPEPGDKSTAWLLAMSTLDPTRRTSRTQGELF